MDGGLSSQDLMILKSGEKEEGNSDRRLFIENDLLLSLWGFTVSSCISLRIEMDGCHETHLTAPLQTLEIASIKMGFASRR